MSFLLPCPRLFAIDAISNALTAQQMPGPGTFRMVAIWTSREAAARRCREGSRERNARTRPVVSNKILRFLETPSSRLASRGQPDRDIGLSRRNPAFMTQRLWI
jgi:hypothetical protein